MSVASVADELALARLLESLPPIDRAAIDRALRNHGYDEDEQESSIYARQKGYEAGYSAGVAAERERARTKKNKKAT